MSKIYIVEDDSTIRTELSIFLSKYNYDCVYSDDFEHIIEHILEEKPDLILLDVNLPYYDGYHICRDMRKQSEIPIIIVTSRDNEMDELFSLNLGADDFVTKPYNMQILLAHIASVLKRSNVQPNTAEEITYNGITLNISRCLIEAGGTEVTLTKNEMQILQLLMKNQGKIISRDDIMNELWQSEEFVDDNTLTVNINRLRKKIKEITEEDYIVTKRGLGYMV